ncbi:hypothetical protein [Haliangium sp.]|uniref:hypothetical protein n=1 Tax=Haliangium sp. TaxID=2663208 RepID=UPI003D13421B
MFLGNEPFIQWLRVHADPLVSEVVGRQSTDTQSSLRGLFEGYGLVSEPHDLMAVARALGMAVAEITKLSMSMSGLDGEADDGGPGDEAARAKAVQTFAIECSIALFRLIERGPSGDEHNLLVHQSSDMPPIFTSDSAWEASFARPLVEQAVANSFRTLDAALRAAPGQLTD